MVPRRATLRALRRRQACDADQRTTQVALLAGWDRTLIYGEVMSLKGSGYDVSLLGFGESAARAVYDDARSTGSVRGVRREYRRTSNARRALRKWSGKPTPVLPTAIVPAREEEAGAESGALGSRRKSSMEKPPYRVPSMAEIATIEPNGFSVISTFAGCGGSSLGYRMAGFKVLWASEFVDAARTVYEANAAPGTIVDGRDIREVDPLAVLKTLGLKPGDLDVLDGSPPCASFSTAGKRDAHWGEAKKYSDKTQRTDDLFFEFVRFVRAMQPKVFVAENVSGLVKGVAKGYFLNILAAMKSCGYRVEARLLDAQWLGVPQARQRIIFVGVREDLGLAPAHPDPLPYRYSVREAIPWITSHRGNDSGKVKWRSPDEPSGAISTDIPSDPRTVA
jgi:hypothetical protein